MPFALWRHGAFVAALAVLGASLDQNTMAYGESLGGDPLAGLKDSHHYRAVHDQQARYMRSSASVQKAVQHLQTEVNARTGEPYWNPQQADAFYQAVDRRASQHLGLALGAITENAAAAGVSPVAMMDADLGHAWGQQVAVGLSHAASQYFAAALRHHPAFHDDSVIQAVPSIRRSASKEPSAAATHLSLMQQVHLAIAGAMLDGLSSQMPLTTKDYAEMVVEHAALSPSEGHTRLQRRDAADSAVSRQKAREAHKEKAIVASRKLVNPPFDWRKPVMEPSPRLRAWLLDQEVGVTDVTKVVDDLFDKMPTDLRSEFDYIEGLTDRSKWATYLYLDDQYSAEQSLLTQYLEKFPQKPEGFKQHIMTYLLGTNKDAVKKYLDDLRSHASKGYATILTLDADIDHLLSRIDKLPSLPSHITAADTSKAGLWDQLLPQMGGVLKELPLVDVVRTELGQDVTIDHLIALAKKLSTGPSGLLSPEESRLVAWFGEHSDVRAFIANTEASILHWDLAALIKYSTSSPTGLGTNFAALCDTLKSRLETLKLELKSLHWLWRQYESGMQVISWKEAANAELAQVAVDFCKTLGAPVSHYRYRRGFWDSRQVHCENGDQTYAQAEEYACRHGRLRCLRHGTFAFDRTRAGPLLRSDPASLPVRVKIMLNGTGLEPVPHYEK
ncbi:hypothetical protein CAUPRSCDRAFT_11108 [Caulochytrium protostelioides]|uniref:Uncharacterized protein n=1 Tax=Caulochytrium protostelioides TaxID=1555241 RepID=A0A4P9WXX8_9FUNG|nr:hypothetical protein CAUPRSCDRAFT_11108 [Caulochytrium protostelioides]